MCTKALSLPTSIIFVSPIVLLFQGTNKPIKICLLCIFLERSRGPSKKVFVLIAHRATEQEMFMQCNRTNFNLSRSFFYYYHRKLLFWTSKRKGDTSFNFQVTSEGITMMYKVKKCTDKVQSLLRWLRRQHGRLHFDLF